MICYNYSTISQSLNIISIHVIYLTPGNQVQVPHAQMLPLVVNFTHIVEGYFTWIGVIKPDVFITRFYASCFYTDLQWIRQNLYIFFNSGKTLIHPPDLWGAIVTFWGIIINPGCCISASVPVMHFGKYLGKQLALILKYNLNKTNRRKQYHDLISLDALFVYTYQDMWRNHCIIH